MLRWLYLFNFVFYMLYRSYQNVSYRRRRISGSSSLHHWRGKNDTLDLDLNLDSQCFELHTHTHTHTHQLSYVARALYINDMDSICLGCIYRLWSQMQVKLSMPRIGLLHTHSWEIYLAPYFTLLLYMICVFLTYSYIYN